MFSLNMWLEERPRMELMSSGCLLLIYVSVKLVRITHALFLSMHEGHASKPILNLLLNFSRLESSHLRIVQTFRDWKDERESLFYSNAIEEWSRIAFVARKSRTRRKGHIKEPNRAVRYCEEKTLTFRSIRKTCRTWVSEVLNREDRGENVKKSGGKKWKLTRRFGHRRKQKKG